MAVGGDGSLWLRLVGLPVPPSQEVTCVPLRFFLGPHCSSLLFLGPPLSPSCHHPGHPAVSLLATKPPPGNKVNTNGHHSCGIIHYNAGAAAKIYFRGQVRHCHRDLSYLLTSHQACRLKDWTKEAQRGQGASPRSHSRVCIPPRCAALSDTADGPSSRPSLTLPAPVPPRTAFPVCVFML